MTDTIKAEYGYRVRKLRNAITNEKTNYRAVFDGYKLIMVVELATVGEFNYHEMNNECFEICEVFTTQKGNQFIYWRDNEIDQDYITKIN